MYSVTTKFKFNSSSGAILSQNPVQKTPRCILKINISNNNCNDLYLAKD